jgi:hypothetical protein
MKNAQPSAGDLHGVKGRRTIRGEGSAYVGLWSMKTMPGSTAHRLEQVYLKALSNVDAVSSRKSEASKSGQFTPEGVKADTLRYAAEKIAPDLHRGKHQVAAAKKEAAELRAKIQLPQPDRTDLVGAMLRAEMRDWIRSMPKAERDSYMAKGNLDPQIATALLEVPAELLPGVSQVQRAALVDRALEAAHPGALAEVQELEHAIELAERAVNLGKAEVARDAEVSQEQLDEASTPYLKNSNIAWLRKTGDAVKTVDLRRGITRDATPEELANGMEFEITPRRMVCLLNKRTLHNGFHPERRRQGNA